MFNRDLWNVPIPQLTFTKYAASSTQHVSNHQPIDQEFTNMPFGVATDFSAWVRQENLDRPSTFLCNSNVVQREVRFTTEDDIHTLVGSLLMDIVVILGLETVLQVFRNSSYTNEQWGTNRADFWVVMGRDGRPLLVVEIKSPRPDKKGREATAVPILQHPRVVGQGCDYMLNVRSFNGLRDVFCITSTAQQFRFHWFPASDELAAAADLPQFQGLVVAPETPMTGRTVSSSVTFDHTQPGLVRAIATVIIKAYCSPVEPVRLITPERMYIVLTDAAWLWQSLSATRCAELNNNLRITLTRDTKRCQLFTVLRAYWRQAQLKVWLTLAGEELTCLAVVKQCVDQTAAQKETALWQQVNGCPHVFHKLVSARWSVVMPLVIHARIDPITTQPTFVFDLRHWCLEDNVVVGHFPALLHQLSAEMEVKAREYSDVREVAVAAIEKAALRRVVHDDLAWRHIALMPVVDRDGRLLRVEPVLIDFGRTRTVDTVQEARGAMLAALQEM